MKIEEIRLRWFRGAAEESVLRTEGKSIVVYGPNASGKSCFTDSLEYVLGAGRIDHLRHEYSGYYQQRRRPCEPHLAGPRSPSARITAIRIEFLGATAFDRGSGSCYNPDES